MRDIALEIAEQVDARQGIVVRNLFWVKGKERETGQYEELGFWNGSDVREFVINGQPRTYYGAGSFIGFGALSSQAGLLIKKFTATAAPMAPEVEAALRLYEPRFAPVEAHMAFFDPLTMNLVADPHRIFKGWVDTISIRTPIANGEGSATINMVGHTRILTRKVPSKRSNETQILRNPNDTFFKDVAVTGTLSTPWGTT